MNGNLVGASMLAYLRGERDLFRERERVAEMKRQLGEKHLGYWLGNIQRRRVQRFWQVVSLLEENARMPLTEMSKRLKVPVSTLFDMVKEAEKFFHFTIVLKDSERDIVVRNAPIDFDFSYQATADEEEGKQVGLSVYAEQSG